MNAAVICASPGTLPTGHTVIRAGARQSGRTKRRRDVREMSAGFPPRQLVWARKELYVARFEFERRLSAGLRMQKPIGKIRVYETDPHTSDGYYVLISLICIVVAMTCALIVTYGIEMLV